MAQGAVKKSVTRPGAALKKGRGGKKNGDRVAKPQKAKGGSSADKLQKKLAAGLVAQTEKLLGERAGHLELIGKGKKARAEGEKKKGGTRKFG